MVDFIERAAALGKDLTYIFRHLDQLKRPYLELISWKPLEPFQN